MVVNVGFTGTKVFNKPVQMVRKPIKSAESDEVRRLYERLSEANYAANKYKADFETAMEALKSANSEIDRLSLELKAAKDELTAISKRKKGKKQDLDAVSD